MLVLSPLAIEEPFALKIEADSEGDILRGGSLRIRERGPQESIE